jgi:hypothetical protein
VLLSFAVLAASICKCAFAHGPYLAAMLRAAATRTASELSALRVIALQTQSAAAMQSDAAPDAWWRPPPQQLTSL